MPPKIDEFALDFLERHFNGILERIVYLAEHGSNDDAVKLKANQILLNKIIPDKNRLDISQLGTKSPYDIIMEQLEQTKIDGKTPQQIGNSDSPEGSGLPESK